MDDTRFCLKRFNSKFGLLAKKSKKKNEKKKKTTATKRDGVDGARDAPLEVKKKRERVFADDVVEGAVPADFESGKKRKRGGPVADPRFDLSKLEEGNLTERRNIYSGERVAADNRFAFEQGDDDDERDEAEKSAVLLSEQVAKATKRRKKKEEELRKRGVVYIASVPPFMRPAKMKHLLSQFSPVTNLYLVPEDDSKRKRRQKGGGNRKIKFVEGWAEFKTEAIAESVADTLNGTSMGGKKRNHFSEDIWMIKYLPDFKWRSLTERFAAQRREREQKLRYEISKTKKRNENYLQKVDRAKEISKIKARKELAGTARDIDADVSFHQKRAYGMSSSSSSSSKARPKARTDVDDRFLRGIFASK